MHKVCILLLYVREWGDTIKLWVFRTMRKQKQDRGRERETEIYYAMAVLYVNEWALYSHWYNNGTKCEQTIKWHFYIIYDFISSRIICLMEILCKIIEINRVYNNYIFR